jgi:5-methylcytosine-specific restriction endonuclease McrA
MDSVITKHCRVCGDSKPPAEMVRRSNRKDGCDTICVVCNRLRVKKWGVDNPEKKRVKQQRWERSNPDYRREQRRRYPQRYRDATRKWQHKNPDKVRRKNKIWRIKNADKEYERKRRWFQAHRERIRELNRQWRLSHGEQARIIRRRSEQANLEVGRIRKHRRRAKKKGNAGTFTVQEWHALKAKYSHRCLACLWQEPEIQLHQDHVIPINKGGANTIDNIQPLCRECNSRKGTRIIDYRSVQEDGKD